MRNPEITNNQLGSEPPGGRERVFINRASVTAPSGTREGSRLPTPQGNQRGKTPTRSELGPRSKATEGASKSPSKFRTFSQTSSPAHPATLPLAGPGRPSKSQPHRWEPRSQPTLSPFLFPSHRQPGPLGPFSHLRQRVQMFLLAADANQLQILRQASEASYVSDVHL